MLWEDWVQKVWKYISLSLYLSLSHTHTFNVSSKMDTFDVKKERQFILKFYLWVVLFCMGRMKFEVFCLLVLSNRINLKLYHILSRLHNNQDGIIWKCSIFPASPELFKILFCKLNHIWEPDSIKIMLDKTTSNV